MNQYVLNGLVAGLLYSLLGLSVSVIYAPTRFFHFAHGAVFAWAAYCGYVAVVVMGLPLWSAVPVGSAAATVLGIAVERAVYLPLRRRAVDKLGLLLASLGIYVVLENLISLVFGDSPLSLGRSVTSATVRILGARVTNIQLWTVALAVVSFAAVWAILGLTRFGTALRAVADDSELARARGVDPDSVRLRAFALGSALVGAAGGLYAVDVDIRPLIGFNAIIVGVTAMIAGGVGSVRGALIAGLLLGLGQNLVAWRIGTQWQDAVTYGALLVFLLGRPRGMATSRDNGGV